MTRPTLRAGFMQALQDFEQTNGPLPGLVHPARRAAFIEQLVDSARRTQYFERLLDRPGGLGVSDPTNPAFNPLRAAIIHERAGHREEAFWLVFLFVHFGKHRRSGWSLIADVYGQLGSGATWSWDAVSTNVNEFRRWLDESIDTIKSLQPRRGFGNHRKYESLSAWTANGTGAVVASYVKWVGPAGHDDCIARVTGELASPVHRFDALYKSVRGVHRFGRTAAFDYCSTLGKLALAAIEPSAACLAGATGPLTGARLLLCNPGEPLSPSSLEAVLTPLRSKLEVGFDVLEDALCNWQKSPDEFKPFRG